MGKYEQLIKEDGSFIITPKTKKLKDTEKVEKDKFQESIEILSDSPCEVGYDDSEKKIKGKDVLHKAIPLSHAVFKTNSWVTSLGFLFGH